MSEPKDSQPDVAAAAGRGASTGQTDEALRWLWGARIQRIDQPTPALLCVTLYAEGKRQVLMAGYHGQALPALTSVRPRGDAAPGFVQKLRKRIQGARLECARWKGGSAARPLCLEIEFRGRHHGTLHIFLSQRVGNVVCCDAERRAIIAFDISRLAALGGRLGQPIPQLEALPSGPFPDTEEAWQAQDQSPSSTAAREVQRTQHRELQRRLKRAVTRVRRRIRAIEGDLARTSTATALREDAQWLLAHLRFAPERASHVTLPARSPSGEPVQLQLDPALSAVENAEVWFSRARRYDRGAPIARTRLCAAQGELAALEEQQARCEAGEASAEAFEKPAPPPVVAGTKNRAGSPTRLPFRRYLCEGEHEVWVGRGARDNDALTLRFARPHYLWLHLRDGGGAHVVVPLSRAASCPDRLRLDAALLAAHFSTQRGEDPVDVVHVERRYVRKTRASPPGAVQLQREKVLRLRQDPARLRWLLTREMLGPA